MKNTIAVIGGAGHIGLPLSCLISNQGMSTIIIDNNKESIEKIQNKIPVKLNLNQLLPKFLIKYFLSKNGFAQQLTNIDNTDIKEKKYILR